MFVDPIRRARGRRLLVATAVFAAGCDNPAQNTDLRPEGPPEVLAVLVMNDAAFHLKETATYCKKGDEKRPTLVGLPDFTTMQVCNDRVDLPAPPVANAYPDGWYIRIMFDELLDPDVEELEEILDPDTGEGTGTFSGTIANTLPVKLECESVMGGMREVEYDGYYSPSGNAITWPLGPSLVIKPNHPELIATNKKCQVTINPNVVDKDGTRVPDDQVGPFAFYIAPIMPIFVDPEDSHDPDEPTEVDGIQIYYDNIYVQFNTAHIDLASIGCDDGMNTDQCEFTLTEVGGMVHNDVNELYSYSLGPPGSELAFGPYETPKTEKSYVFDFKMGGRVKDHCGVDTVFGAPSVNVYTRTRFNINKFDFKSNAPSNGDTVSALRKLSLQFNNVLDPTSLDAAEWTLTPAPEAASIGTTYYNDGDFLFLGNYRPGQMYTFTLKGGAKILDFHGAEYTQTADKVITWTVAPIAITSTTPSNGGEVEGGAPVELAVSFNQAMDPTTLLPTEWQVTDANGAVVPFDPTITLAPGDHGDSCGPEETTCTFLFTSTNNLAPGQYTFTLKKDATIADILLSPTIYTQASDRVVNFTVTPPSPPPTPIKCL